MENLLLSYNCRYNNKQTTKLLWHLWTKCNSNISFIKPIIERKCIYRLIYVLRYNNKQTTILFFLLIEKKQSRNKEKKAHYFNLWVLPFKVQVGEIITEIFVGWTPVYGQLNYIGELSYRNGTLTLFDLIKNIDTYKRYNYILPYFQ